MKFKVRAGNEFDLTIENEDEFDGKIKVEKGDIKLEIERNEKSFLKDFDSKTLLIWVLSLAGAYGLATGDFTVFNGLLQAIKTD